MTMARWYPTQRLSHLISSVFFCSSRELGRGFFCVTGAYCGFLCVCAACLLLRCWLAIFFSRCRGSSAKIESCETLWTSSRTCPSSSFKLTCPCPVLQSQDDIAEVITQQECVSERKVDQIGGGEEMNQCLRSRRTSRKLCSSCLQEPVQKRTGEQSVDVPVLQSQETVKVTMIPQERTSERFFESVDVVEVLKIRPQKSNIRTEEPIVDVPVSQSLEKSNIRTEEPIVDVPVSQSLEEIV